MLPRFGRWPGSAAPFLLLLTAAAQEAATPQSPSVALPAPTPTPFPDPPFLSPPVVATPAVVAKPPPTPTPTPRPSPSPATGAARPNPASTGRPIVPAAAATPFPVAQPSATPTPTSTGSPHAVPTPRRALPPIETVILPPPRAGSPLWPWLAGAAGVVLAGLGLILLLRRRHDDEDWIEAEPTAEAPAPPVPPDSARLSLGLQATRAGLNLISATAECEVTITNVGGVPARDVRAMVRLMSSHEGQDAELAAFYTDPVARPAAPAFTLAPGEERRLRVVLALAHEAIHAFDAGGRPMFAPIVAMAVRYRDGDALRHLGQAYALGGERPGSAKLVPLWLDGPARQYDHVATRMIEGSQA